MRTYPFEPRSNRTLKPGDYWAIRLTNGRFACGRVLQIEGELLTTKTQGFFGGLHDWVGDCEPNAADVQSSAIVEFGTMHVKAIRETGGAVIGNVPLSSDLSEIPELMDAGGGPGTRVLKGVKVTRKALREEWGTMPVLRTWGYNVIRLLAEKRFAARK